MAKITQQLHDTIKSIDYVFGKEDSEIFDMVQSIGKDLGAVESLTSKKSKLQDVLTVLSDFKLRLEKLINLMLRHSGEKKEVNALVDELRNSWNSIIGFMSASFQMSVGLSNKGEVQKDQIITRFNSMELRAA